MLLQLVPYDVLMEGLDVPTVRELEDILIETIYSVRGAVLTLPNDFKCMPKRLTNRHSLMPQGLVQGKLDQKSRAFIVKYAVGRDTQNEDIDSMIAKLTSWYVR